MKKNLNFIMMLLLLLLCTFVTANEQQKSINGKVSDTSGESLPGVSIIVKGTNIGAVSDIDGNYTILNVPGDAILVFSFIGMETQEVVVAGQSQINVTMADDAIGLEEVVAIGYGSVKRRDLTGSVASVKVEEMTETKSVSNFEGMLQGRVAGVQVIDTGNDSPSGGSIVRIRGASSLEGSKAPLVVVDGVPIGHAIGIREINPVTISSIEVLKDASSTAIYGSRGANGVIMITTKSGEKGKTSIYVDHKTNLGFFSDDLDYWRDPIEMMELINEAHINADVEPLYIGQPHPVSGVYYPSIEEVRSGAWPYHTVWEDYIFRKPSVTNETSIGILGGTDKNKYRINTTYYTGEGMRIGHDYDKITVDFNYENQVTDFLRLHTRTGFFKDERNNVNPGGYRRNPLFPVYNGDGTPFKTHITDYGNPVAIRENVINKLKSLSGYVTLQLDVDFHRTLEMVLRVNGRAKYVDNHSWNPVFWTEEGDKWNNRAWQRRRSRKDITSDGFLTFSETFDEKHNVSVMVGVSSSQTYRKFLSGAGVDFPSITLKDENLGAAAETSVNNVEIEEALLSGFTRLNYNYKGKYYATFTARADGSSRFGANNRWGYFPSGALSWRLSEEHFIRELNIFDNLKIRASYGFSGSQAIPPYRTNTIYGPQWIGYEGEDVQAYGPGVEEGREGVGSRYIVWGGIGNKSLRWEKTSQLDFGLNMSLLDNRLNVVIDVYRKHTTDLLRRQFMAPNSGFDRIWTNDGEIENKGFELALDGQVLDKKGFQLNAGIVFSMNRNKVLSLGDKLRSGAVTDANGLTYEPYGAMPGGAGFTESFFSILAVGHPVGVFYGYQVDGIIQDLPENPVPATMPGELNYVGMDENGTPNPDKRVIIGDPTPDFTSSLNLSLKHTIGLDLSMQWYLVYGNDILSRFKITKTSLRKDRWTFDNPSTTRPRLRVDRRYHLSDYFVEDGTFLRLKSLTIGYNLPKIPYLKSGRVFITGTNLLTFTDSIQNDPEIGEDGFGTSAYPKVSSFSIGVQLSF